MSASCEPFVFQTTQRCHSVFSCLLPCWSFQLRLVAREKVATRPPPVVERTSGSFPRLPISITLLRLRLTVPPGREWDVLAAKCKGLIQPSYHQMRAPFIVTRRRTFTRY